MMEAATPAEPILFRVLIDEAMKLTRRHFRVMYLPVAVPLAILTALVVWAQMQWMGGAFASGAAAANWFSSGGCLIFAATLVVSMALQGLITCVLTAAACDGAANRPVEMKAKWTFVLAPATLGTLFVAYLLVIAGFICLVLPGVLLAFGFSFLIPVMAVEGLRGPAALKRSWRLVRYNPHRRFVTNTGTKLFLLYLVAGLISYFVGFLVQLPFAILRGITIARSISSGSATAAQDVYGSMLWTQLPSAVLGSLVSTAVYIYTAFGIALLYFDVVRRKEGVDLATAIDARFGTTPGFGELPPAGPLA
jgi:hypothetical protein